jgi:hypothetical protein
MNRKTTTAGTSPTRDKVMMEVDAPTNRLSSPILQTQNTLSAPKVMGNTALVIDPNKVIKKGFLYKKGNIFKRYKD